MYKMPEIVQILVGREIKAEVFLGLPTHTQEFTKTELSDHYGHAFDDENGHIVVIVVGDHIFPANNLVQFCDCVAHQFSGSIDTVLRMTTETWEEVKPLLRRTHTYRPMSSEEGNGGNVGRWIREPRETSPEDSETTFTGKAARDHVDQLLRHTTDEASAPADASEWD